MVNSTKITTDMLLTDLRKAGIKNGDMLLVHSSLRSIGFVDGGALTVINALTHAVDENGSVLFPCLTFPMSVTEYLRTTTRIDLRKVNISTGVIPKTAWNHPKAFRSIHPTHPVAGFGNKTKDLISGIQSGQGPVGTDSPFYKQAMSGGKILLIGASLGSCTTLHCVEETSSPYIFSGDTFNVETIDFNGMFHSIIVKGYCVGIPRDYHKIEPKLIRKGIMRIHPFGQAELRIIDAKALITAVTTWVEKDPWLLVSDKYAKK